MSIPVVVVTVDVFDTNGAALVGAIVKAKITGRDVYQDQIVERNELSATTNAAGRAQLSLFPNTLGESVDVNGQHTAYTFKIYHPTTERKIYQTTARVPNAACNLTDIAGNLDGALVSVPVVTDIGIVVKVNGTLYSVRRLQVDGSGGLTVTNDDGVAGNPLVSLAGDLAALEALNLLGLAARTAASTWVLRQLVAPAAGISVSNPAGTGGDPTLALANDLLGLESLAGAGFPARTAVDTWAIRTLQAPAAGITITNPAGTAGNPTLVLANDLAGLEALAATGLPARTAADTWVIRTLQAPAAGFTITNPGGVAGDPTFVLANDLAAIEALAANGVAVRTGVSTWTVRTLTGSAGITLTNGDGVAGAPDVSFTLLTTKGDLATYGAAPARLPVGTNGQILAADSTQTNGLIYIDNPTQKNLLVNPNNLIDQVNEGALYTVNAADVRGPDGISGTAVGTGVFKLRRVVDPDHASLFATEVTCTTADAAIAAGDDYFIYRAIEGYDAGAFLYGEAGAKVGTYQFDFKSNVTGVYGVSVMNSAGNRRYVGSITVADTAEHTYSLPFTADTTGTWLFTNGVGLYLRICLAAGTNFQTATPNTWAAGAEQTIATQVNFMSNVANVAYLKRAIFIPGALVQAYGPTDLERELAKAQRQQCKTWNQGVAVGTVTNVGANHFAAGADALCYSNIYYPVTMRATPTGTTYSPATGAAGNVRNEGTGADVAGGFDAYIGMTKAGIAGVGFAAASQPGAVHGLFVARIS